MVDDLKKPQESSGSSNRTFGLIFSVFFFVVGAWPLLYGKPWRPAFLVLCGVVLLLALILPRCLAVPNRLWMLFGEALHKITSPIALAIIFYGLFTSIGFVMRLLGKDFLRLKFEPHTNSYWIDRLPPGPAPDSLRNQF